MNRTEASARSLGRTMSIIPPGALVKSSPIKLGASTPGLSVAPHTHPTDVFRTSITTGIGNTDQGLQPYGAPPYVGPGVNPANFGDANPPPAPPSTPNSATTGVPSQTMINRLFQRLRLITQPVTTLDPGLGGPLQRMLTQTQGVLGAPPAPAPPGTITATPPSGTGTSTQANNTPTTPGPPTAADILNSLFGGGTGAGGGTVAVVPTQSTDTGSSSSTSSNARVGMIVVLFALGAGVAWWWWKHKGPGKA